MEQRTETYNTVHFNEEKNRELSSQIIGIEQRQKLILDYMIEFLLNADWTKQMKHCDIYLKLISKIRFNLEPINNLLPLLLNDYRYKVSLNLLYRAVVDDLINIYYLIAFYDSRDKDQLSLASELKVLHSEFLNAWVEIYDAELKFIEVLGGNLEERESLNELTERVKLENPDFYDGDRRKKNRELRANGLLFKKTTFFQNTRASNFISEKQKLDFISEIGRSTDVLRALFKYFSQFHHFTPKTHDLQNNEIEYELQCYRFVGVEMMFTLSTLSKFIVFKDKNYALSLFSAFEQALGITQN